MIGRFLLLVGGLVVSFALIVGSAAGFSFQSFEYSIGALPTPGSLPGTPGPVDTRAGSHPWSLTTSFRFDERINEGGNGAPDEDVKDVEVDLPAGLVGDSNASQKCTMQQFTTPLADKSGLPQNSSLNFSGASCPVASQVGFADVILGPSVGLFFAVYNLVAPPGVPAEFGMSPLGIPIVFTASVRADGNYNVAVNVGNISQALYLFGSKVTFWGVPSDPSHDTLRGECLGDNGVPVGPEGGCPTEAVSKPFLTLPTSCSAMPPVMSIHADPWQEPNVFISASGVSHDGFGNPVGLTGCGRLHFSPSMTVRPHSEVASSPTGIEVDLKLPQSDSPNGLAESHLKEAVVTLPAGMAVNPSAADGREACSPDQIAMNSASEPTCPAASKLGTVQVVTPLLEEPLTGSVFLAQQTNNPFGTLLALYLVAEGNGVLVKLAGRVHADPVTGQLTATFDGNPPFQGEPQLPFSELKLDLFGGPRAALITPAACGSYAASALLTPWSGTPAVSPAIPSFKIEGGCGGGFAPSFAAGTASSQAGAFSPFVTTFSRTDQDQNLGRVSVHTPPGLLGMLSKVQLCGEPQAAEGACPDASKIGHVTVGAGAGPSPVFVPQPGKPQDPVYLTGPYKGAPFGLSVVVPAQAGPFDLGTVVVRSTVDVDPHTGQLTIASDPLPSILQGIPLNVRTVSVTVDKEGFTFNPTNCAPLTVDGTIASTQGASAKLSSRFQAANCANLPFHPSFKVSTQGQTSKANGASLTVEVTSKGGPGVAGQEANLKRVDVQLPKLLPSRLSTLQKACTEAQFAANPAGCPAASNVGTVLAHTPALPVPLQGPAYLVSHGSAAFPDLVIVLQGDGVRIDLVGNTLIRKGITYSKFDTVPDAPISAFKLTLPQGPHSALATPLRSLCKQKLLMPTTIEAQNGAVLKQNTKIAVSGCARAKTARRHSARTARLPRAR